MINRLYVNNFRCLENFELVMSDRPSTLLIGKNGAGKSTVSFALEVFQSIARGVNRVGALVKLSDFWRSQFDIPVRFEIEALIDGAVYDYRLAFELPEGFKELRVLEENLTVAGVSIYSRQGAQVELAGTKKGAPAKFLVDWHLVALPLIHQQSVDDPLFILNNWLARMLILAPIPSQMTGDSEGETLMPDRQVKNFGEWFSGLLAHSPAAYALIDKYLKEVMTDFRDIKNPISRTEYRSLTVQFKQGQAVLSLPFGDLSDGEKCFFICALVLASNDSYGPLFCLWDEPDNYLALSEVGYFVAALRRSFQSGGQLLITSHNAEAIQKFSDENTFVLGRRSHLEPAMMRPLSDMRDKGDIIGDLIGALVRNDVEI